MPTASSRIGNLISRRAPSLLHNVTKRQVKQFRNSEGSKGNKVQGKPIFLLDVVGRKSGELRPVMLMLVRDNEDILVAAAYGGNPKSPNWWLNLKAAEQAHVEVGSERWPVTVDHLEEGPAREAAWTILVDAYPDYAEFQKLTTRQIPVAVLRRSTQDVEKPLD